MRRPARRRPVSTCSVARSPSLCQLRDRQSLRPRSDAPDLSRRIWCSSDKIKAWDDYLQRGIAPTAEGKCQNPVDKIVEYGRKKGINGTPTLVFESGARVPGAISAAQIENYLSKKEN